MQKTFDKSGGNCNGLRPFSLLTLIRFRRQAGGFWCSTEHGKLCFEALETPFVPQNNLPLHGAGKHPPKSGFMCRLKMDL